MNIDNKKYIENRAELERFATEFKKRHPLTPSDKKELKALVRKIIRIVEKTKKTYPGKKGWKYSEQVLDKDLDLYPHLRNHVIKVAKRLGIELTIQRSDLDNKIIGDENLYNETIGDEAENIMIKVFKSKSRRSKTIVDLEEIPLEIANEIKNEMKKPKYKVKHLTIVQHDKDLEPDCMSEQGMSNDIRTAIRKNKAKNMGADIRKEDTALQTIKTRETMTIEKEDTALLRTINTQETMTILIERLKEILKHEQYEIFVLRAYEGYTSEEISELKGLSLSRVKQIYRTARAKAMKDKRIKDHLK